MSTAASQHRPGPASTPILQVHPSLRCNLACSHCYSGSSPTNGIEMPLPILLRAVQDAADMGYRALSVSGGEPLLYRPLPELLARAKRLELRTSIVTNGYLLTDERVRAIADITDVVALSIDGPREIHDRVRRRGGAFDVVIRAAELLRKHGVRYGFIHTATSETWAVLPELAELCFAHGAKLLQIHPLEREGRAKQMANAALDHKDLLRVFVLAELLRRKYEGAMAVHADLMHRDWIAAEPSLVYGAGVRAADEPAQILGLLVVEAEGHVVPVSYGFSRAYRIASLGRERLIQGWESFIRTRHDRFTRLCRDLWSEIVEDTERVVFNWHELVTARSHSTQH